MRNQDKSLQIVHPFVFDNLLHSEHITPVFLAQSDNATTFFLKSCMF